jgi:hypothetical protein
MSRPSLENPSGPERAVGPSLRPSAIASNRQSGMLELEEEGNEMSERYTLSEEKLAEIARVGGLPLELVREWCLASWPKECCHQEWLDSAPAGEIAVWIEANSRWPIGGKSEEWERSHTLD